MHIIPGDLDHRAIINLLHYHMQTNVAVTPVGSVHALDLDALKVPEIDFFAGWQNDDLMVIGALMDLGDQHGELKSMRTVEQHRAKGLGAQMLDFLIAHARAKGIKRLSLETGSFDYFEPARRLYAKRGFEICPPFANYEIDENSTYMTKAL